MPCPTSAPTSTPTAIGSIAKNDDEASDSSFPWWILVMIFVCFILGGLIGAAMMRRWKRNADTMLNSESSAATSFANPLFGNQHSDSPPTGTTSTEQVPSRDFQNSTYSTHLVPQDTLQNPTYAPHALGGIQDDDGGEYHTSHSLYCIVLM